jgi:hypothetical protein
MHGLQGSSWGSDSDNDIKATDGQDKSFFASKKVSKKDREGEALISAEKLRAKFVMKVNHFAANSPERVMPGDSVFGFKKSVGGGGMGN